MPKRKTVSIQPRPIANVLLRHPNRHFSRYLGQYAPRSAHRADDLSGGIIMQLEYTSKVR